DPRHPASGEVAAEGTRVFWTAVGEIRRARSDPHLGGRCRRTRREWVWAPEVVPPENLMRAVEGAWPKARPERSDPPAVEAPELPSRRAMARERARWHRARKARRNGEVVDDVEAQTPPARLVGAELCLREPAPHFLDREGAEAYLRMLLAQAQGLEPGEAVVVQILARPAPGKVYRRLLKEAGRLEA